MPLCNEMIPLILYKKPALEFRPHPAYKPHIVREEIRCLIKNTEYNSQKRKQIRKDIEKCRW